jgi:hypothetical protein
VRLEPPSRAAPRLRRSAIATTWCDVKWFAAATHGPPAVGGMRWALPKCHGSSRIGGLVRAARRFRAGARGTVRRSSSRKWQPPVVRLLVWRMDSKASCLSSGGRAGPLGCAAVTAQRPPAAILLRAELTGGWSTDPRATKREPSARRRRRSIRSRRRALIAALRCVLAWLVCRARHSTRLPARGRRGRCREEPDAARDRPRRRQRLAGVRSLTCPRAKDI